MGVESLRLVLIHDSRSKVPAAVGDGFSLFSWRGRRRQPEIDRAGSARHFCELVSRKSIPRASMSIFTPVEGRNSIHQDESTGWFREALAQLRTGFCTPVEVRYDDGDGFVVLFFKARVTCQESDGFHRIRLPIYPFFPLIRDIIPTVGQRHH